MKEKITLGKKVFKVYKKDNKRLPPPTTNPYKEYVIARTKHKCKIQKHGFALFRKTEKGKLKKTDQVAGCSCLEEAIKFAWEDHVGKYQLKNFKETK